MQILLRNSRAGRGRTVKQQQEEISRNHVQTFIPGFVVETLLWLCCPWHVPSFLPSRSLAFQNGFLIGARQTDPGSSGFYYAQFWPSGPLGSSSEAKAFPALGKLLVARPRPSNWGGSKLTFKGGRCIQCLMTSLAPKMKNTTFEVKFGTLN